MQKTETTKVRKVSSCSSPGKTWRVILLSALMCVITTSAFAQKKLITLNYQGGIIELLTKIEASSNYVFFYYNELIDRKLKVNVSVKDATIEQLLDKALAKTNLTYSIKNNQISLKEKNEPKSNRNTTQIVVKGIVSDETGERLPGVSISVQGNPKLGVTTDIDGMYTLNVPDNAVLNFSYVGYAPLAIPVKNQEKLGQVVMVPSAKQIEEVIVVGYTSKTREKLISSVSTVNNQELVKSSVPNLENALVGRVSGVFARQSTGEPGSDGGDIKIRGFGSALVVVDGIPGRNYSELDPSEIESISVLKDASAAAVYGMQGANGVILVTTKRGGRNKKTVLDVSIRFGVQQPVNYPETASTMLWQTLQNEYNANMKLANDRYASFTPDDMKIRNYPYNTNWQKEMIRNALISQSNVNVSGGTDRLNYFVSGGYLFQDGIWATNSTNKNRFNLRSNLDIDIYDNLKLSVGLGAIINKINYPANGADAIARELKNSAPNIPVRYPNRPEHYAFAGEETVNPMALADPNVAGYDKRTDRTLNADVTLEYKVKQVPGLSVKATFGYNAFDSYRKQWTMNIPYIGYKIDTDSYYTSASASNTNKASLLLTDNTMWGITGQGFINYANSFQKHSVNAGLVFEISESQSKGFNTSRGEFPSTVLDMMAGGNASKLVSNGEWLKKYRAASIIGRFSYDFDTKYFVDFNFRYDGAQYFSDKWGFFPSASVGWFITRESFMESVRPVLNDLKLRASWGVLGDLSAAKKYYDDNEQYYFQSGYKYPGTAINIGDRTLYGLTPTVNANPDFTWATSRLANVGIDYKFWKGLLSGSAEFFYRERRGLPAKKANDNAGALATYYNLNRDNTRGFEISLNHENKVGDFTYNVGGNISWSRTQHGILEHGQFTNGYGEWKWNNEGHWNNIRWGHNWIGNYQSYDEIANAPMHPGVNGNSILLPGDLRYEDWNGDGYIDDYDQRPIGRNAYPELVFGINLSAGWKGLDLSMFFQGAGRSNFQLSAFDMDAFGQGRLWKNTWSYFEDRWHMEDYTDPNSAWVPGHFPAVRDMESNPINRLGSNFWMFSGNYLRLKNIELGYSLPQKLIKKVNIKQLRIYVNAYNLLTFSSQKYFDPEQKSDTEFSLASYPQTMSFNVGLNLKF